MVGPTADPGPRAAECPTQNTLNSVRVGRPNSAWVVHPWSMAGPSAALSGSGLGWTRHFRSICAEWALSWRFVRCRVRLIAHDRACSSRHSMRATSKRKHAHNRAQTCLTSATRVFACHMAQNELTRCNVRLRAIMAMRVFSRIMERRVLTRIVRSFIRSRHFVSFFDIVDCIFRSSRTFACVR